MKKISALLIIFILIFSLAGCSQKASSQKTEEELRAEVMAEMEAEEKQKEESQEDNTKASIEDENTGEPVDIRDNDAIFEFVSKTYPNQYTREDYDLWTATYLDITEDGNDEVVFTTTYGDGKLESAIIITGDNGKFEIIPSDIQFAKYKNDAGLKDGFFTIYQKSGGSGMGEEYLGLFVYDGQQIKDTGLFLEMYSYWAFPNGCGERNGTIDGNYKDFTYTLNEVDTTTDNHKTTLIEKSRYVYDKNKMVFTKESLTSDSQISDDNEDISKSDNKKETVNDYTQGYNFEVKNGSVFVTFNNTGNKVEVYNPSNTTIIKDDGNGVFTFQSGESKGAIARTVSEGNNKDRLYFTTNPYEEYMPNDYSTLYVDMKDLKVYFVGIGDYSRHVTDYPYTNWTILVTQYNGSYQYNAYDSANQYMCEIGNSIKSDIVAQIAEGLEMQCSDAGIDYTLKGFNAETINNEYIDYSQYIAVIVPMHSTNNLSSLTRNTCSFADNPDNIKLTFAIFGEMQDIKITYLENMDSTGDVENMGTLKNAYVDIYAPFGSDMSMVKVEGKVHIGEGYYEDISFTLDDARDVDAYAIYKVK